ncbi:MAG: HAD-IIB family hydrolase [Bacilli bacterium]|nr:HAD-IIB family hydrolase [Bacilli bacterium]
MGEIKDTLIATDLDGTYLYPKHRFKLLQKSYVDFSKRFIADGGRLLFVTSRNKHLYKKLSKKVGGGVDMIGCNGSLVFSGGELVKESYFDNASLVPLMEEIEKEYKPMLCMACGEKHNLVVPRKKESIIFRFYLLSQVRLGDKFVVNTKMYNWELKNDKVYKMMVFIGWGKKGRAKAERVTEELKAKYPDYEWCWSNEIIEITPKGCTKSSGLSFYLDYNHISHDNVLVVGDSGNDISMFEEFQEHSYCMAHGPASVRMKAKYTIRRFDELEKVLYPSADSKNSRRKKN